MLRLFFCIIIVLNLVAAPVLAETDSCGVVPSHQHSVGGDRKAGRTGDVAKVFVHCCCVHAVAMPSYDNSLRHTTRLNPPVRIHISGYAALNPAPLLEPPSHA